MGKGQSLVEFALSITILIFLLGGVVEFGFIFFQFIQLRDAAQEGALFGSACPVPAMIEERVRSSSNTPLHLSDPGISVTISLKDYLGNPKDISLVTDGDAMTVRVTYLHKIFMPFVPDLIGRTDIPLNASVTNTVLSSICQAIP